MELLGELLLINKDLYYVFRDGSILEFHYKASPTKRMYYSSEKESIECIKLIDKYINS